MSPLITESVPQMETLSPVTEQRVFVEAAVVVGAFCISSSSSHPPPPFVIPLARFHRPSLLKKKTSVCFLARGPASGASGDGVPHSCPCHCLPIITP